MLVQNFADWLHVLIPSLVGYFQIYALPLAIAYFVHLCWHGIPAEKNANKLPVVNRILPFEPQLITRIRWGFWAKRILQQAHVEYGDDPYVLARGDMDVTVLPASMIPELNQLPAEVISTREFHAHTLLGHITGIDIVRETGFHVKVLLNRLSPALPQQIEPMNRRISAAMTRALPQTPGEAAVIKPLELFVEFISEAVALMLYGSPLCDDPEIVRLCHLHTRNSEFSYFPSDQVFSGGYVANHEAVFTIVFVMRFVPSWLQSTLVWLLPWKWSLARTWKAIQDVVVPEIERRRKAEQRSDGDEEEHQDCISWMVRDGKTDVEQDPEILAKLVGALTSGSTFSTAGVVSGVIANLRNWTNSALNSLPKLDSVMKETARLTPAAMVLYSRHVEDDFTLSTGLKLHKGQRITTVPQIKSMNPETYRDPHTFDGLRHCGGQAFRKVDNDVLTWGSGRWACPGRFVANVMAKMVLVKLILEYDFRLVGDKKLPDVVMHEFTLFNPFTKLEVQRRDQVS
ncbi:uncharacterized protein PG998_005680 [Apiospora kogelbergensis]|uniref:uncharacterized protein n=1 Tax=Apiospora kogelbergensis TaxID=1337665 RepID=UPI003131F400